MMLTSYNMIMDSSVNLMSVNFSIVFAFPNYSLSVLILLHITLCPLQLHPLGQTHFSFFALAKRVSTSNLSSPPFSSRSPSLWRRCMLRHILALLLGGSTLAPTLFTSSYMRPNRRDGGCRRPSSCGWPRPMCGPSISARRLTPRLYLSLVVFHPPLPLALVCAATTLDASISSASMQL